MRDLERDRSAVNRTRSGFADLPVWSRVNVETPTRGEAAEYRNTESSVGEGEGKEMNRGQGGEQRVSTEREGKGGTEKSRTMDRDGYGQTNNKDV